MAVCAADDVLLVAVWLAALDHVRGRLVMHHFVHMHLDGTVPAAGDDRVVRPSIRDKRDDLSLAVALKLLGHDTGLEIEYFKLALVASHDELAVVLVQHHLRDVRSKHVLDHADRLACPRIPNLDAMITRHENF